MKKESVEVNGIKFTFVPPGINEAELELKILRAFFDLQVINNGWDNSFEASYEVSEEGYLVIYKTLEKELKISREELRPVVLEIRNKGFIKLSMGVDFDGVPHGSGYILTEKGLQYCLSLGFKE